MENPEANQLPEVDSLPDGFVESPSEPLAPKTPILEQEKPLQPDYKEDDLVSTEFGARKGQKQRTFPVPLSEGDSFDSSLDSVESKLVGQESSDSVPEAAEVGVAEFIEVKGEVKGDCQTAERFEGGSETKSTDSKETSSSESVDSLKNKKPVSRS